MNKFFQLRWLIRMAILASFGLMGCFLWQHVAELRAIEWRSMVKPVALSLLLYLVALGIQGVVWIRLFVLLIGTPWSWKDVKTYFTTHLMRRLPGAPWYIAGRAATYRERSPAAAHAALVVSLFEWGGFILTGLVWAAGGHWGWLGLVLSAAVLGAVVSLMRSWRWLRRWVPLQRFPLSTLYLTLGGYTLQWGLAALMLHSFLRALAPIHTPDLLQTSIIWAISGVVSGLAVFAPAGLGIRELSLVALLEPHIGLEAAVLGALLMRVVFTVGDMLWSLFVSLISLLATSHVDTP